MKTKSIILSILAVIGMVSLNSFAEEKPRKLTVDAGASSLQFEYSDRLVQFGNLNTTGKPGIFAMIEADGCRDGWLRIESKGESQKERVKPENITIVVDRPFTVTKRKDGKYVLTFAKPNKPSILPQGMWRAADL